MRCVYRAYAVERHHYTETARVLDSALESAQIGLAKLLLVHIDADTASVVLLIVKSDVLGSVYYSEFARAENERFAERIREHGVFGKILGVSSVVRRTVVVQAAAPNLIVAYIESRIAEHPAPFERDFGIEARAEKGLRIDCGSWG